jgi:nicotinamide-nucleotide amidase
MATREAAARREAAADDLSAMAAELLRLLQHKRLTLVVAESCTAGLMGQVLSDAPGAAAHFHGGFVTYTKAHKASALDVPMDVLRRKGAVCIEVAQAMAQGALAHSPAQLSAAITGVAGPEPDPDNNPVGRVCIAVARQGAPPTAFEKHYGDIGRDAVRERAIADALQALIAAARQAPAEAP